MMKVFILGLCLAVLTIQGPHTFDVPVDFIKGKKERFAFALTSSEDVTFSFMIPATPTIGVASVTFVLQVFNAGANTVIYSKSITASVGALFQDSGWTSAPVGSYEMTLTTTSTLNALAVVQFDVQTASGFLLQNMIDTLLSEKYRLVYAKNANTQIVCTSPETTLSTTFQLNPVTSLNDFQLGSIITGTYTSSTKTTTFSNLATGFYLLKFQNSFSAGTRTYQTDVYNCPSFLQGHTDFHMVFEGCVDRTTYFSTPDPYPDTFPVFNLPGIQQRQVIHIQLDFIHQNPSAANNKFKLFMMDATGNGVFQPLPFNQLLNVPAANTPFKTFWTAPFAGTFNLLIISQVGAVLEHLQIFYLTIYRSNGDLLVTAVDILREVKTQGFMLKYMHFDPTPQTILLSTEMSHPSQIKFKKIATDYSVSATTGTTSTHSNDGTNYITGITDNLGQSSNYLAFFQYSSGVALTIGVRSDPYQCPYDTTSTYVDLRKIFQHCVGSTPNAPAAPVAMSPTVYGDTLQITSRADRAGRFYLWGNIASGDKLKFTLTFRLPVNALPTKFNVKILNPSLNIIATIVEDEAILEEPEFVKTFEWTSTFTGANNHFVEVTQMGTDVEAFRIYELLVESLETDPSTILTQSTDILRNEMNPSTTDKLFNLIYLKDPSSITVKNTIPSSVINLYAMGEDSEFIKFVDGISITTGRVATADNLGYTFSNLAAGWYGAEFIYDGTGGSLGSIFFQSNTYACPYNAAYSDFRGAFDPCKGQETMVFPASRGSSSPINLHQLYIMQSHRCTSNQFFNGSCNNMDPSKNCNTFNALSGDCTTCPSTKYSLYSGACVIPKQCSLSEIQVGTVCVSILCKTSDEKGLCTSCKSALNEVKADGSCGPKSCVDPQIINKITGNCDKPPQNNCEPGYFPIDEDCYLLPPNCKALSPFLTCEVCDDEYTPESGSCVEKNGGVEVEVTTSGRVGGPGGSGGLFFGVGGNGGSGGNRGFETEADGAESITFLKSRFFRDCGDIDEEKEVCNFCKAGATFVKGNFCAFA